MKPTLKNLLLLNSILLSVLTFDTNCMKRSDSTAKLSAYDEDKKDYFPRLNFDEYLTRAQGFSEASMRNNRDTLIKALEKLEKIFGSKPYLGSQMYTPYDFRKIQSIDIGILGKNIWKDIETWIEEAKKKDKEEAKKKYEKKDYEENFNKLLDDLVHVRTWIDGSIKDDKYIEEMCGKVAGSGPYLFNLSKLNKKNKKNFKRQLIEFMQSSKENFKRVMLLYFRLEMIGYSYLLELPEYLKDLLKHDAINVVDKDMEPQIVSIDISFPNLMNFAVKFAATNYPDLCKNLKDPSILHKNEAWNLSHVLFVYKKFEKYIDRIIIDENEMNDDKKHAKRSDVLSGLSEKEKEWLLKSIIGNGMQKLFNVNKLKGDELEHFKRILMELLGNATGFQLIMSLITADTINRCKKYDNPFHKDKMYAPKSISVEYSTQSAHMADRGMWLEVYVDTGQKLMEQAWAVFHELTHAYHCMIDFSIWNNFVIFSILNNPYFDSIDRFFSMLNSQVMDAIVPKIKTKNYITEIGKTIQANNVLEIANKAIRCGFGNVLFKEMDFTDKNKLDIKKLLEDKKFVQTCLYLNEAVLPSDDEELDAIWNANEEMLTMQGFIPVLDENKCWIVEDRQNEHIYRMREMLSGHKKEYEIETYRQHININKIIKKLKGIVDDKKIFDEDLKKKFKYPQKYKFQKLNLDDIKDYKGLTVKKIFNDNGIPF